ncbi:Uncharacterised protein [Yersinia intermedia]|uniref:glycosyltransferase family 2 protein n=1 Tax=Yersinia intermedia TaxID=631 RepID=UPI0005ABFA6B|nr:glycosyltransferase family 2 protein [Yersinia intermedia]AJJ17846.1 nucleotidyl transferase family protein [Yersinia intermedia]MDA5511239.1 glycosyltransferase family 2 protein [Yersinia intermedia]MDN0114737.1 glycosyltransferase family 2 protein [Yersinia intermedia]CNH28484.1 Uncharacterised protein [Yersinia intermedia]CNH66184.1 Uncharacterised protein [Yersinia intermedia]
MNVLILAAGDSYIDESDHNYPLCLTEINGISLIQRISDGIPKSINNVIYLFQEKHIKKFHLDNIVSLLSNAAHKVIPVPENTAGAACTALLGVVGLPQSDPLLIISANQLVDVCYDDFLLRMFEENYDAGTIIFDSIHPRYSYVLLDSSSLVVEASEKKPISRNATAGIYWFNKTSDFSESVKNMIRKDARVGEAFYICPSFNELVLNGKRIGVFKVESSQYHPLKSAYQLDNHL